MWKFTAPTHRRDLNHKWDLAEEAARFAGYDNIPVSATRAHVVFADNPKGIDLGKLYAQTLIGAGFCECKNIDFIGEKELKLFGVDEKFCIRVKNALAQGWDYLRPTLLPSLIKNVESNLRFGNSDLKLFETSKTFQNMKRLFHHQNGIPLLSRIKPRAFQNRPRTDFARKRIRRIAVARHRNIYAVGSFYHRILLNFVST